MEISSISKFICCMVSEHPFMNVTYKSERARRVIVSEGKKRLTFEPRIDALPPPNKITW